MYFVKLSLTLSYLKKQLHLVLCIPSARLLTRFSHEHAINLALIL